MPPVHLLFLLRRNLAKARRAAVCQVPVRRAVIGSIDAARQAG